MEDARLIANPYLLANNKNVPEENISFFNELKGLLKKEYSDIYLSDKIINNIKDKIDNEIYSLRINQIITECLDSCISRIIEENKFDFCLPFD